MPYYEFLCEACGAREDHFRKIEQRTIPVYHCAREMIRLISKPSVVPEIAAYVSPASGRMISSRAQRRDDLAREGCILMEPGLKEHIASRRAAAHEATFKPIDQSIDKTVSDLHASGLV